MVLTALGVQPTEERVYRALVGRTSATSAALAAEVGLPDAELAAALAALEAQGLVARAGAGGGPERGPERYVAAPPNVALGALLNQRRDELSRAESTLSALATQYRSAVSDTSASDLIEVLTGAEGIRHRFDQIQRSARREVLAFVAPVAIVVSAEENVAEDDAIRRGVDYRVVVERAALTHPGGADEVHASLRAGEQIRVVEQVPLRLAIADRSVAMVPLGGPDAAQGPSAVLVHTSGLLDALVALFESVWDTGHPVVLGAADDLAVDTVPAVEEVDSRILSLLLIGLTDRSVASQLGLSMRTVQRRVRYLMDLAGVQTRLQLGWHAARHGWV